MNALSISENIRQLESDANVLMNQIYYKEICWYHIMKLYNEYLTESTEMARLMPIYSEYSFLVFHPETNKEIYVQIGVFLVLEN